MASKTVEEIGKMIELKTKWKIKTNQNKFKVVRVLIYVKKMQEIVIDRHTIPCLDKGKSWDSPFGRTV